MIFGRFYGYISPVSYVLGALLIEQLFPSRLLDTNSALRASLIPGFFQFKDNFL